MASRCPLSVFSLLFLLMTWGISAEAGPEGWPRRHKAPQPAMEPGGALQGGGAGALCTQCAVGTIVCGQSVGERLGPGDCLLGDGSYVDVYRFELPATRQVTIELSSTSFDTYLMLQDSACLTEVAFNDDCQPFNFDLSCVTIDLAAGTYYIFANSFDGGETGSYRLEVKDCSESVPLCERCVIGSVGCGQRITGSLSPADCTLANGSFVDIYRLELTRLAQATIQLRSSSFDTFLVVEDSECLPPETALNDDCQVGNFDLSCVSAFLEAGTYFLQVTSFAPAETGSYSLEIVTCDCPVSGSPSRPSPEDGERKVPTDVILSWNGGSPPAGVGAAEMRKTVYGEDDRLDEYQVVDPALLSAGDSTVAMVPTAALTENRDGTFSLPKETMAVEYQREVGRPLCNDEPFLSQPSSAQCSGFLVSPNIVATAGHCVTSSQECGEVAFIFGYVMLDRTTPVVRVDASQVYFCADILARQEDHADWALIRLDRPVTNHAPLPIRRNGMVPDNQNVVVIGHPLGLPRKYAAGRTTRVRENTHPLFFQANVDTYGGNSGSAIFDADSLHVEGILVRGNLDFRAAGACDRSNVCPDAGCPEWEDATRTTVFSGLLPSFDLYLGRSPETLELIASDLLDHWYQPDPLEPGRRYHWRVVAKNQCGVLEGPVWSFMTPAGEPLFHRGDTDDDGVVQLTDAVRILNWLFRGGPEPTCLEAADADNSGEVQLTDAIRVLNYLFRGGPAPVAPGPHTEPCGPDDDQVLGCESYTSC